MSMSPTDANQYHIHIYFDDGSEEKAQALRDKAGGDERVLALGCMHTGPIGPHPQRQFQLLVGTDDLASLVRWVDEQRLGLSVLIHPEIDDDLAAHTTYARWLGQPVPLRLERFR